MAYELTDEQHDLISRRAEAIYKRKDRGLPWQHRSRDFYWDRRAMRELFDEGRLPFDPHLLIDPAELEAWDY